MVEEVKSGLYRMEIPMPESPLKSINSYVVKGEGRDLIIDTGLNRSECFDAMQAGLAELEVDLENADFFITHLHADHFGLVERLKTPSSHLYFNRRDAEIIENWAGWEPMLEYVGENGFPQELLRKALSHHPGFKYRSNWNPEYKLLRDGDTIGAGGYTFRCVSTPGHTRGHVCLYEPNQKILISGDHILIDITPNIQCWTDEDDPLGEYLQSLDKVYDLEVELVLPGHRRLFSDHRARIDELKGHHRRRCNEALEILADGPLSAYDCASKMSWDIKADSWRDFPLAQQWFATMEAISHLRYLQFQGSLERIMEDGVNLFRLAA